MTLLRESYLYHLLLPLWTVFYRAYEASFLASSLARAGAWCSAQIEGSRLLQPLCREGSLAKAWPESFLCRVLTALINLPICLLHWLYRKFQLTFDDSFFARLAFQMGDETAIAQSWLILLLWIFPYFLWNNAYTLIGFVLVLLLFHAGSMRSRRQLDLANTGFYTVLLWGAMALGVLCSYAPSSSLRYLFFHISAALCVLATVSSVRNGNDLKRLAGGAAGAVAVCSLYGIYQRMSGLEVNISYVDLKLNPDMPGRVYSFYDNPNTFAEVLILLLPIVLALALCSKRLAGKIAGLCAFGLGTVALVMTYSRASWVGFACAMAVMLFLWKPKLIPFVVLCCCFCVPFLPDAVFTRILTIVNFSDTSTSSRFPLYEASLRVLGQSPITGAGLGTAAVQAYIRDHNLYHARAPYVHAHNMYLEVWLETGLLGIIAFFGAMMWNIKRAARTVRRCADSAARVITCGAAAAMCGMMVCGLADYPWHYPRVLCIFWFTFAMALAGAKVCLQEKDA